MAGEDLGSLSDCFVTQSNGKRAMAVTGGGQPLDIAIQDQSTDVIGLNLGQTLDTITILSNTLKNDETVDIETTGVVPIVGNFVCFQENLHVSQFEITTVTPIAGNQYTVGVDIPIDYPYTTAGGCRLMKCDMNVNGSVTPVDFFAGPAVGAKWDITRIIVSMVLSSQGDDGLFGNLTALTNGQYFRKEDSGDTQNLFNIKDNADFRVEGFDLVYPVRSGGGGNAGMASRISFNGADKRGVTIRLNGDTGDTFLSQIRDDLTGLVKYRIKIQGHVVEE